MNCPICNSNIPDDSTFCPNCKTAIIVCSKCGSYLPGDSKFCPDCGTPVVNIEELRLKAKEITVQYKKGYDFYVNNGILPRFVYNLTVANCEKIVAMETEIINKHLLIGNEELKKAEEQRKIKEVNRRAEEQRIRDIASGITIQYAKAYDYYVSIGVLPRFVHNLDIAKCQKIISKKNDIIERQQEIEAKENRLAQEKRIEEEQKPTRTKSTDASHSCASNIAFSWGWFFISIVLGVVALFCGWLGENHTLGIIGMVVISIIVGFIND